MLRPIVATLASVSSTASSAVEQFAARLHGVASGAAQFLLHNDRKFSSLCNNYALDIICDLKEPKVQALGKYAR